MEGKVLQLLQSHAPENRKEALRTLATKERDEQGHGNGSAGFGKLLSVVIQTDPAPDVRAESLQMTLCPTESVHAALFDKDVIVRKAAIEVIRKRSIGSQHASSAVEGMLALLAVESEQAVVLEVIRTLGLFLRSDTERQFEGSILFALGGQNAERQGLEDVFERNEAHRVFCDLADDNSPHIRDAMGALILQVFSWMIEPSHVDGADISNTQKISTECFAILEQLLHDSELFVREGVVKVFCSVAEIDLQSRFTSTLKLSEKSVKALLKLAMSLSDSKAAKVSDLKTMQVLRLFHSYSCGTIRAYGYVETYLRRCLYRARSEAIDKVGSIEAVEEIRTLSQRIVSKNFHFAKVLDLVRPVSDKLTVNLMQDNGITNGNNS